ncbi:SDR family oxidoreductase [Erwinia sorbitola]|uniref:SDR family oxidoreductase n=1 Tax=Erwinia sorbitola TaxID=2681984 RepID=A0A6I6EHW8_9GAMM|nr:SDR family oxidoreductase [Erwinia sorbitola]MTD25911.1 SDR family oxidoreductase [Erwinia sorbitola]QGU87545.1 SDR family oxidoreductase [Erwinia sorbitola]
MTHSLSGNIAVITGGTQGLGAAIAQEFVNAGAAGLIICGRNSSKGLAVAERLSTPDCRVHFVKTDLSNVEECRHAIHEADREFGRLDILVNAGGMTDRGTILDTEPELFDQMFATNVRGPFYLMQESIKLMKRDNIKGSIVNICSMSGLAGQPFIAAYCASKGALATLTRNTAFATLRNNIRVNGLNIGWMASEGEDRTMREFHGAADNWLEEASAQLPFGRLIDPAEVARAVCFLASTQSGLMTGSMINYDQSVWGGYDNTPAPAHPL